MTWFGEKEAAQLAARLHFDQADKAGMPYIGHLSRVADRVRASGGLRHDIIAAWLHDSVEDTEATLGYLEGLGVPAPSLHIIDALTWRKGESRNGYLMRIMLQPGAPGVKACDIYDNLDPARLSCLDKGTRARLMKGYGNDLIVLAGYFDQAGF